MYVFVYADTGDIPPRVEKNVYMHVCIYVSVHACKLWGRTLLRGKECMHACMCFVFVFVFVFVFAVIGDVPQCMEKNVCVYVCICILIYEDASDYFSAWKRMCLHFRSFKVLKSLTHAIAYI